MCNLNFKETNMQIMQETVKSTLIIEGFKKQSLFILKSMKLSYNKHILRQGWAASTNLREESSVFRVVARFLYFFLLNNMKDWCFF